MKFTVEETNLMCIYGTDTRENSLKSLEDMQTYLQDDETQLKELTKGVLIKLNAMSDSEFKEVENELVADFE